MTAHVAIIGSALAGNKGAAAMLEAAVRNIGERVPGTRFTLFSMYPDEDRDLNEHPELTIVPAAPRQLGVTINALALLYRLLPPMRPRIIRRSRAIRALVDADVLLDQGGITFSDGREKFLLYNVASILPALLVGTPVFKCAQAVGPFRSPLNRVVAKLVLPRVHTIVTRGRITHAMARDLGLSNIVAGADLAFTLEMSGDEDEVLEPHLSSIEGRGPVVGIAPSIVLAKKVDGAGGDYVAEMQSFISHLASRGIHVVLVPHSARRDPQRTHNNDLPLCRRISDGLDAATRSSLTFVDAELSSQALRRLIGHCDAFVTSRFHAMVSGLATTTPTLVIGWSHKYEEVLEMFEAESWAFGHADLTQDHLRARFDALWEQRDTVRATLADHLPDVKALASDQVDRVSDLLST